MSDGASEAKDLARGYLAARGLLLIVPPIVAVTCGILGTKYVMDARITKVETDSSKRVSEVEHKFDLYKASVDARLQGLDERVTDIRNRFDHHSKLGDGGIPHPAGLLVRIDRVERAVERLKLNREPKN